MFKKLAGLTMVLTAAAALATPALAQDRRDNRNTRECTTVAVVQKYDQHFDRKEVRRPLPTRQEVRHDWDRR
jgi:hypothetical protein